MALGDGTGWDETSPNNSTNLRDGDDHQRDHRIGNRIRLAKEHVTPAGASVGGEHKFMTMQVQAVKPPLSGSQVSALYVKDVGAGVMELFYEDELGNEIQVTSGSGVSLTAAQTPPTASIIMWSGALASPPTGWLTCDGSAISRTTFAALFAITSTVYGVGDGSTTFNLPNMTNRFPYGANEGVAAGNASVGSTGGRTPAGNDNAVTMQTSVATPVDASVGGADVVSPNSSATADCMPRYLALGYIIKT